MDVNFSNVLGKLKRKVAIIAALLVVAGAGAGLSEHWSAFGQERRMTQAERPLPSPSDLSRAFIDVAKRVEPAVVNIEVVEKAQPQGQMEVPEGLQQLFPQIPGLGGRGQMQPSKIGGSGVIITADGYILTNNHVAGNGQEISVTLADGRKFKAKKIGTDPETDLAVIKINATGLPYAELGNSDDVEQGQWVVAIGSPFGLPQTMTAGIVSAIGRRLNSTYDYYIQTDASINPGNSGGPLVNMEGKVVGINTLIYTRSGGNEGIGFAIPSSTASKIYASLVKYGKVDRGYLGIYLQPVSQDYATAMGLHGTNGALVQDFPDENTPAARAGLHSGDVITEFDGKPVKSDRELTAMVADEPIGKTVTLKYMRDGEIHAATLKLAARPPLNGATTGDNGAEPGAFDKLGISVTNVTPSIAESLQLKVTSGAVVQNVEPGSPADDAGLQRGDVIHRVNRTQILNASDLSRALGRLTEAKAIVMQVETQNVGLRWVTINLE